MLATTLSLCAAGLQAATVRPEKTVMAVVNGAKITAGDLTAQLWWQHGAAVLSEMIDEKLVLEEAARLKISADPKEIESRVTAMSAGLDKGQFEKNLKMVGWTETDVRELIKRQLMVRETVMAAKKISVTDEDLKAFYDENKDKLNLPEAVKLSQIFVDTKADADAALESLAVGANFAKLSALKSTDAALKKNGGSLGFISKGSLLPDIEKEVFGLEKGAYSKIFPTGKGFSIFYVEEHRPAQPAVFEDIKVELKVAMLNQTLSKKLPELAAELKQKAKLELVP